MCDRVRMWEIRGVGLLSSAPEVIARDMLCGVAAGLEHVITFVI